MYSAAARVRANRQYMKQQWESRAFRIPKIQAAIRAIQNNQARKLDSLCREIGDISQLVRPPEGDISQARQLANLLDLLAKQFQEDAEEQAREVERKPGCKKRKKEQVHQIYIRLQPGSTKSVQALKLKDGRITVDQQEIGRALGEYWESIFAEPEVKDNRDAVWQDWLQDLGHNDKIAQELWQEGATGEAVYQALKNCSPSSPGPDGIPYSAWQNSEEGQRILKRAFTYLERNPQAVIPQNFNWSRFVCIPKKPAGQDPELGIYFFPRKHPPFR